MQCAAQQYAAGREYPLGHDLWNRVGATAYWWPAALWTLLNLWSITRGISGRLSGSSTLDPERPSVDSCCYGVCGAMEGILSIYYVHGQLQRAANVSHRQADVGSIVLLPRAAVCITRCAQT